ncbi:NADPH2:quinone reductase [Amycolatopsis arida]|uniref:NADPH2:quinone reductase n=1 Tax=Amycolatopsis arida TaxID=587909 RepID=A0A1I5ZEL5_9PSEU|nr:zinc-binding dehydrogenase [Amycolatopsis arida]TDX89591.1 NADPH2:quinone reductase [Amycolatopsis arida]SFQ54898.1 NADPH2:quinone reductase [Amycolatopsis arida]
MRAIQVAEFGGPEVLVPGDVPDPVPGPGQALLAVAAVDVLFVETQIRRGGFGEYFDVRLPYVPGGGVGGEVVAVGDPGDADWVGRRVVTQGAESGAYAERAAAPVGGLVPVPDGLGLSEATALVHDGHTAMVVLEQAALRPGEWVLVTGAAGGMGVLLVQLAVAAGARVVAAARGERKLALVRELGAEVAVDHTDPGWVKVVRDATGGRGADVVLDGIGGEVGRAAFEATADGGRFSAHGAPSGEFARVDPAEVARRGVTLRGIDDVRAATGTDGRRLAGALAAAAEGRVRPVIGQTFPLERAADAHAAIEARAVIGKTLLLP